MGPGGAILQALDALDLEARHPLAHRFDGDAERGRDGRRRLSFDHHPPHQVGSTVRREPGILMNVHPVLRDDAEASQLQLPRSEPDGQPDESSHLVISALRIDRRTGAPISSSETRVSATAFWEQVSLMVSSALFFLAGRALPDALGGLQIWPVWVVALCAVGVLAVVLILQFAFAYPANGAPADRQRT